MSHKLNITPSEVQYLQYLKMERSFQHHSQNEDMLKYTYMQIGDMRSVDAAKATFVPSMQGCLSKDPIRNLKYLFVVAAGLASRFAVEGGLPIEIAYSISDLYIQKADELETPEEITELHLAMFAHYTKEMQHVRKQDALSRPVNKCIEYIDAHLSEHLTLSLLAEQMGLSSGHLASLFKKELGQTIGEYITNTRIETAKNMLNHSEYAYSQISASLGFSSQSHFTKVFREKTGYTPKEYRMRFYLHTISDGQGEELHR